MPQKVTLPSVEVSSELETLGQNADGVMATLKDPDLAGWCEPGPTRRSEGSAVILVTCGAEFDADGTITPATSWCSPP